MQIAHIKWLNSHFIPFTCVWSGGLCAHQRQRVSVIGSLNCPNDGQLTEPRKWHLPDCPSKWIWDFVCMYVHKCVCLCVSLKWHRPGLMPHGYKISNKPWSKVTRHEGDFKTGTKDAHRDKTTHSFLYLLTLWQKAPVKALFNNVWDTAKRGVGGKKEKKRWDNYTQEDITMDNRQQEKKSP